MKYLASTFAALSLIVSASAQTNTNLLLSQYFQNLPAYSPALTGMNDQLDITLGVRQQWTGFDGSPRLVYLSAYGVLNSKKMTSSAKGRSAATPGIKQGAGGYVLSNEMGAFKQSEVSGVYAVHVPVAAGTYFSLGISGRLYNGRIDLSDVWVKDQVNDQTYQSLLQNGTSNTYLHVNTGLSLYSEKFYLAYSIMDATHAFLSGNEDINQAKNPRRHHVTGGYRFSLRDQWEIIPNTFVRIDQHGPLLYEMGVRARYQENIWAGMSVRNDKTLVGMVGMSFQNKVRLGYAFEYAGSDITQYNQGTHELVLGLNLFRRTGAAAMW